MDLLADKLKAVQLTINRMTIDVSKHDKKFASTNGDFHPLSLAFTAYGLSLSIIQNFVYGSGCIFSAKPLVMRPRWTF